MCFAHIKRLNAFYATKNACPIIKNEGDWDKTAEEKIKIEYQKIIIDLIKINLICMKTKLRNSYTF